jgi:hypothetical protein
VSTPGAPDDDSSPQEPRENGRVSPEPTSADRTEDRDTDPGGSVPRYPGQRYPAAPGHVGQPAAPRADETWVGDPYPSAPWGGPQADPGQQQWGPPAQWGSRPWSAPPAGLQSPGPGSPGPPWAGRAPEQQVSGPQYPGQQWAGPGSPPGPGQPWAPPGPQWAAAGPRDPRDAPAGLTAPLPKRRGRALALVAFALVVVGAVVAAGIVLVRGNLGSYRPAIPASYQPITTPFLTYSVPQGWTADPAGGPFALGVGFEGRADAPSYTCRGDRYIRGSASSALVSDRGDPAQLATQFATRIATQSYTGTSGREPTVTVVSTTPVQVPGPGDAETTGSLVEVRATPPSDDGCLGTEGLVLVLAVPTTAGGQAGTALLTSGVDTAGGPATPPLPPREEMDLIAASAALPG